MELVTRAVRVKLANLFPSVVLLTFRSWHFGCAPVSVLISENAAWCSTRTFMARAGEWLRYWGPFEKEPHEQAKSPVSWAAWPTALQVFAEPGETSELTLSYCHCEMTGTACAHLLSMTRQRHVTDGTVMICCFCLGPETGLWQSAFMF